MKENWVNIDMLLKEWGVDRETELKIYKVCFEGLVKSGHEFEAHTVSLKMFRLIGDS